LNKMEEPFLGFLFSLTSHHPYEVEDWFKEKYPKMEKVERSVLYTDYALQQFFKKVEKTPWFDRTLFIITADHIGAIKDPNYKTKVHKYSIPILFYQPSKIPAKENQQLIQQIDILPSIMDHLNYDENYPAFGLSAFDTLSTHYAYMYSENIFQILDESYILLFDEQKTIGLYNYIVDPFLKKDLKKQAPKILLRLENQLKGVIQRHHQGMVRNQLE